MRVIMRQIEEMVHQDKVVALSPASARKCRPYTTYSWEYPQLQLLDVSSRFDCVTLLFLFYRNCCVQVVVWYPSDLEKISVSFVTSTTLSTRPPPVDARTHGFVDHSHAIL